MFLGEIPHVQTRCHPSLLGIWDSQQAHLAGSRNPGGSADSADSSENPKKRPCIYLPGRFRIGNHHFYSEPSFL